MFSKKKKDGIYLVMSDENSKELYINHLTQEDFTNNLTKYSHCLRFDSEKEAIKNAKSRAKSVQGWTFAKERCNL